MNEARAERVGVPPHRVGESYSDFEALDAICKTFGWGPDVRAPAVMKPASCAFGRCERGNASDAVESQGGMCAMAGLSLEGEEWSPRDDGLPFEEEPLFEWLFGDTDPHSPRDSREPGPDGRQRTPSTDRSASDPRPTTAQERRQPMVERPENQPQEPDTPEGEQGEQGQPGGAPQTPPPTPSGGRNPGSSNGEDPGSDGPGQ